MEMIRIAEGEGVNGSTYTERMEAKPRNRIVPIDTFRAVLQRASETVRHLRIRIGIVESYSVLSTREYENLDREKPNVPPRWPLNTMESPDSARSEMCSCLRPISFAEHS